MSFDPRSLDTLRSLGKQLPQELPKPKPSQNKNVHERDKLHPIETERNPQTLFQELIKASPDGKVPSHLLARLKEIENNQLNPKNSPPINSISNKRNPHSKGRKEPQEEILYASFDRFLLEEED